jgi:hypothetical protein
MNHIKSRRNNGLIWELRSGKGIVQKRLTCWHSPPSSVEVMNALSYTSTPQYVFMVWYLVKHRDKFTFTFFNLLVVHFMYRLYPGWMKAIRIPLVNILITVINDYYPDYMVKENEWYKYIRTIIQYNTKLFPFILNSKLKPCLYYFPMHLQFILWHCV